MNDGRDTFAEHSHGDVSRAYQDLVRERTPASLNEKILESARRNASAPRTQGRRWLQPVALAASVCVALAVVLEISQQPADPPASSRAPGSPAANADLLRTDNNGPAADASPARETAESALRMESAVQKFSAPPLEQHCDDNARVSPETWLVCIETLEAEGRETDAGLERRELEAAFPGIPPAVE